MPSTSSDEGLLEAAGRMPDHAYGLHVWSANYPHRAICSRPGALMASSDLIYLTVRGKGGHGSAPHLALDPVPIVAEMITQAQVMVAREFDIFDPVVVTCGKVVAGQAPNVIADTARAEFTLRAFKTATRNRLIERMRGLCQAVAQAHGATCEVELVELYPVTENDPQEVAYVQRHVEEVFPGRWQEMEHPVGAAEDFSKILQRIPGAFVFVSAIPEGEDHTTAAMNHSPNAIYDSARLVDCSTLLATLTLGRLTPASTDKNHTE
ncbi:M20/M25/M40 family metallo-hydrolase [Rothia sp. LK2588]|uniref:M20 family metallopeptidase n=1 Tax=Rothia sp. LK2588 TaxID=3114369 RepID=UPI0034CEDC91